jgi:membrane protein DedA with SNARE-associated domain
VLEHLVTFLQTHIIPLGGIGIFLATIIEEVVAPIPSAFVLLTGGFLFLSKLTGLNLLSAIVFKIALPAAFGITLGSLFIYWLAFTFGKPFIDRFGKWFGLAWKDIEKAEKWFEKGLRDDVFIFIVRAIPFIPSVAIGSFAGIMRLPLRTYIISSFLGTMVRASILGVLGWQLGNFYYKYTEVISRYENATLSLILLGLFLLVIYRRKKHSDIIKTNG